MRDRRRARPALPPHAQARAQLPTSSSSTRSSRTPTWSTAPRNCSTSCCATIRRQMKPVMSRLRLPADRQLSDDAAADARLRRPDEGDGGQGRRSCPSPSAIASPTPTCRNWAAASWSSPTATRRRPTRWRPRSARNSSRCAAHRAATTSTSRTASARRWPSTASPVVMADPADNAGGGAPSDNTTILRQLIERDVESAALGPIWDPIAVRLCFDAGVGRDLPAALRRQDRPRLRPAGRCDGDGDGARARLLAELRPHPGAAGRLRRDPNRRRGGGADHQPHPGARAWSCSAMSASSRRERKLLVVKSTNHFMAAFGPIAKKVIYVDSDGPLAPRLPQDPLHQGQPPDLAAGQGHAARAPAHGQSRVIPRVRVDCRPVLA